MRWARLVAIVIGCTMHIAPALALDPQVALTQYRHVRWDQSDGLPYSSSDVIAQTQDGYLWVGTQQGLARFDGNQFVVYDKRNTPEFRTSEILSLCTTPDGDLWIGSGNGAYRFDGHSFSRIQIDESRRHDIVSVLLCTEDGGVYAGTNNNGLFMLSENGGIPLRSWQSHAVKTVTALAWRADTLVVGTQGDGLHVCQQNDCRRWATNEMQPDAKISTLWVAQDNTVWVGLFYGGLRILAADDNAPAFVAADVPTGWVSRVMGDSDGAIWIVVREAGLLRIHEGRVERLSSDHGESFYPKNLFEDRDGNIWVSAQGAGLHRLSDVTVRTYGMPEGLAHDLVWTVMEDRESRIWVGTQGGVNRLVDGSVETLIPREPPLAAFVRSLAETKDGRIWIGTRGGVYVSGSDLAMTRDSADGSPGGPQLQALFTDSAGRLWAGQMGTGLSYLRDGRWNGIGLAHGYDGKAAWSFAEDESGAVLIGAGSGGLYRFQDEHIVRMKFGDASPDRIDALFVDSSGDVWFTALNDGLSKIRNGRIFSYGSRSGISAEQLNSIVEDDFGYFWIGTNVGLFRIERDELNAVAEGQLERASPTVFDESDGMRSSECNGNVQPLSWKSGDGVLWFTTASGLVRVDPAQIRGHVQSPPRALIEQVSVDEQRVVQLEPSSFPAGTRRVEVLFTAIHLTAPERVHIRYRLEGVDRNWVDARNRRQVEFAGLRAGDYQFLVSASIDGKTWSAAPDSFSFSIEAPFSQTPPFYFLLVAIFLLLGYGYHKRRLTVLHRHTTVLRERSQIARELHDTLAQGFSGMLMRLEVAARMVPDDAAPLREQLTTIQALARGSLDEVRRVIAQIRPRDESRLHVADILRQQSERQLDGTGVALHFRHMGAAPEVVPFVMHHLSRIVEQSISNALMHSGTPVVFVDVEYASDRLTIRVEDQGGAASAGTDGLSREGTGLRGMRERVSEIGGEIDIRREAEGGMRITVTLSTGALLTHQRGKR